MTKTFIAACKRNDRKEMIVEVLKMLGNNEAAEEVRVATRVTSALIDRTLVPMLEDETTPDPTKSMNDPEDEAMQTDEEIDTDSTYFDIGDAIEAGEGKKALKLIKKAKKAGHRGQVLKDLKKQAKELV